MDRRIKHSLRSGATAIAAATGLTLLSYTGQTTDGFVHTNFTGPLSVFGGSAQLPNDVVAIGDGVADASELSALLKATAPQGVVMGDAPITIKTNSGPNSSELSLAPGATPAAGSAATIKQSAQIPPASAQVLDSRGQANCTAAVSCVVDPATNATTVTFADGIVAVVQKINDMTLIAYKSVGDALKGAVDALSISGDSLPTTIAALAPQLSLPTPPAPAPTPLAVAAVAPSAVSVPSVAPSAPVDVAPAPSSAPSAPDITAATITRPRVTVTHAPSEFGTPKPGNPTGTSVSPVNPNGAANAVTNAVDSVVNAVKGALSPGAASSPNPTKQK